jgi:hypothetical protein
VGGLFQLDAAGKLVKHYSKAKGQLPSDHVVDLCSGGGKLYLSFREADRWGIAALDPTSGVVSLLAPSGRAATLADEPVLRVYRVWWDSVNARLLANGYFLPAAVWRPSDLAWLQTADGWQRAPRQEPFLRCIVSQGDEALQVSYAGKEAVFQFLKARQTVRWPYPLPQMIGEPAWDDARIWVPAFTGLYEVERASGKSRWLAHQDGVQCLAALRHGGKLYVATNRGLYFCDIPVRSAP